MSFFEDQEEAWFNGGMEWYCRVNKVKPEEVAGIPGDFDPYVFYGETVDDNEEDGDEWAEMREESRARKQSNLENSTRILQEKGIQFKKLTPYQFRIGDWDFYPSTGKFYNIRSGEKGRGVFNFLKKL